MILSKYINLVYILGPNFLISEKYVLDTTEICIWMSLIEDKWEYLMFFLQSKMSEAFGATYNKLKQTMYTRLLPSASNLRWDPNFLADLLSNPKYVSAELVVYWFEKFVKVDLEENGWKLLWM